MITISSALANAGRDDQRISGLIPNLATLVTFGGRAITQDPSSGPSGAGKSFMHFDGSSVLSASNPYPLGLVIEPTHGFSGNFLSGENQQGSGFSSWPQATGGLYSAFSTPGNWCDVWDDFTDKTIVTVGGQPQNASCPFDLSANWLAAIGMPFTSDSDGYLTTDGSHTAGAASGGAILGIVRGVQGTGTSLRLTLQLGIAIVP